MTQFHRGARVAGSDAEEQDAGFEIGGLLNQALLLPTVKTRDSTVDYVRRGMLEGVSFEVRAVRRTRRDGSAMLKLFFEPLE
jgi:hypothetical protein